ncbi:MAG: response regulator transcription factor [Oscillospiraceae bacterium]|nr:response regulator transcription factor [Oscillospiraceae bacterium]
MGYKILIAEDEPRLRAVLTDYFTAMGHDPVAVSDGISALKKAQEESFDGILLDVMMPGMDGFSVCRALRKESTVPILFLTALAEEEDMLRGYGLGADDYIPKPFSMAVLCAKLAALIRRSRGGEDDLLRIGALGISLSAQKAFVGQQELSLTPKEYALLSTLMQNRGQVLSRDQLLAKCWGYDYEGDARAVDTHIRRLRSKLGSAQSYIRTVIKTGYRLEVPQNEEEE